jgi:1-acyl-sn-glycerol-3-phosphate acyltransferase
MRIVYGITQRITWLVTFFCMRVFCRFSIVGQENLKNIQTPLLVVANHKTYWDSMILGTLFPFFSNKYLPMGFMAADEFFLNPIYNFFLSATGVSRANKGRGLDISLKDFRSILSNNGVVAIFPYGKRIYDDKEQYAPGRGAAVLVKDFPNLTVLPIYLKTTPGNFLFGNKEMEVIVGSPYKIQDSPNKSIEELSEILTRSFLELNQKQKTAFVSTIS